MIMMTAVRIGVALVALTGLAACTSADTTTNTRVTQAGSISNSCINPVDIKKQTIVSDQEIRFEMRNGDVWANNLPRTCPGLKFRQGFEWEVHGQLACSNQQMITVKDEGSVCLLGAFTKLPASS